MELNGKSVFVAGATGLAGSSIVYHLREKLPSVRIKAVYNSTEPFVRYDRVEYIQADLTQKDDCKRAVEGCDVAIMAAATTGGAKATIEQSHLQTTDNLVIDAFLLEALALEGVQRTLFISSASVYQEIDGPIKEDLLDLNLDPPPSYLGVGWAKRSAEQLCKFWHKTYGMEMVIVRASNLYGPFSKFDWRVSNFIPALIRKAVDKMDPFEVWGSPGVTRDVLYAEDFAHAVIALLEHDESVFDVFNLGSGTPTTVGDVVQYALESAGHKPKEIVYRQDKPSTIRFRAIDCSKIRKVLSDWPFVSVEEGIQRTTQWWIENKHWWAK